MQRVGGECDLERIDRAVDGTLEEAERAVHASHLAVCARCRAEQEAVEQAERALRAAFADHPFGPALHRRVQQRLQRGATRPRRHRVAVSVAAAAVVAALWMAATLWRPWEAAAPGTQPAARAPVLAVALGAPDAAVRIVPSGGVGGGYVPRGARVGLRVGDRVVVERRFARLELPGGGRVWVRPDTTLAVTSSSPRRLEVAIVDGPGEVYVQWPRAVRRRFAVRTPVSVSEVHGTRFGVRMVAGEAETIVLSGVVAVRPLAAARGAVTLLAHAGERVVVGPERWRKEPVAAASALAWARALEGGPRPGETDAVRQPPRGAPAAGVLLPRPPARLEPGPGPDFDLPVGGAGDADADR